MSKFLSVPNGNYTLTVQDGGTIRLDTGPGVGEVRITGDLYVEGTTTTIESTVTTINDNVLVLNDGDPGPGVSLDTSGIKIQRGSAADALMVWDERFEWYDPAGPGAGTTKLGGFVFATNDADADAPTLTPNDLVGIKTNSIATGGSNLVLLGYDGGAGVVTVTGTVDYETNAFYYTGPSTINLTAGPSGTGVRDDDIIPNAKSVVDYVSSYFAGVFQDRIAEGTVSPTYVETIDFEVTGTPSLIDFGVDNSSVAQFYSDRLELLDLRILGSRIESTASNVDITIGAPGTGVVKIDDVLHINSQPAVDDATINPSVPGDGLRLYVKTEDTGNTGLFFVNSDSTRDEIISNNRAMVYSMLF